MRHLLRQRALRLHLTEETPGRRRRRVGVHWDDSVCDLPEGGMYLRLKRTTSIRWLRPSAIPHHVITSCREGGPWVEGWGPAQWRWRHVHDSVRPSQLSAALGLKTGRQVKFSFTMIQEWRHFCWVAKSFKWYHKFSLPVWSNKRGKNNRNTPALPQSGTWGRWWRRSCLPRPWRWRRHPSWRHRAVCASTRRWAPD